MKQDYAKCLLEKTKTDYNQIAEEFSNTRRHIWDEIKFLFEEYIRPNDIVLDLGCGNGRYLPLIKEKAGKYFGVDNSGELIGLAKNRYPGENFQTADALELPFEDNFFDKIYCLAVLHHIPSEELRLKFFQEAKRVLKPGGILILTVWKLKSKNGLDLTFELYLILKYILGKFILGSQLDYRDIFEWWGKKIKRYYHCFSQRELISLARKDNFDIVKSGIIKNSRGNRNNIYLVVKKRGN